MLDSSTHTRASIRYDWTQPEITQLYEQPMMDLLYQAQHIHRQYFDPNVIQQGQLLSIRTGACTEDCGYCNQSIHHNTGLKAEKLMDVDIIVEKAKAAKAAGATRYCMGAAWREVKERDVSKLCAIIRAVKDLGLETCVTLGMLTGDQAHAFKAAGLDYYNHNLDTSPEFYPSVVTTRTYQERLDTLAHVANADIKCCSGGIMGMGETRADRISFLQQLTQLNPHPQSVPINLLHPVKGTPMGNQPPLDVFEFVRTIAVARCLMPRSFVRLSAGRTSLTDEAQALCFMAGANSIWLGDKLLTCENPTEDHDAQLFRRLGIRGMSSAELARVQHADA